MNLYQINQTMMDLLSQTTDDGELPESVFDQLAELQIAEEDKLESIGCLLKNWRSDADQLKTEEDNLAERRKSIENRADRLKAYAYRYMLETGKTKFDSPRVALSFRKSKAVDITNESMIPAKYIQTKTQIAKAEISKAIKAGVIVPGAVLVERENLQVK
jgi:hypothetical protein